MAGEVKPAVGVVTKARYAEHRGCSAAYISKLIRQERLAAPALMANGRINVILADQMLGAPGADELEFAPAAALPTSSPISARAEREYAQARIARVRADEMEGLRLTRASVEARVFDLLRRLRDELLAWPETIAPQLVPMTSDRLVADALRTDLEDKLTRLAENLEDLARHEPAAEDGGAA
ncbi:MULTISPECIES: hypothetical protein [Roseomonadaceae]|uniref:Terminase small subunit n=1 Tax=Falsiroseomonas oleicola TaxID=2801474 RepID=A0ABS6H9I3_9PROT|nr:hypothetical protein [Roseomonas oleicola]MBU8543985.1 hypothetical protein [Roseomonas oleicola]